MMWRFLSKMTTEVDKFDWQKVKCPDPSCDQVRKNTPSNKIWFDSGMSDKAKGKMVFFCTDTRHDQPLHFMIKLFIVNNVVFSCNEYVFKSRIPKDRSKKE